MKYKLQKKANPLQRDSSEKFYPVAVNSGKKEIRELAEEISGRSSLTRGDVESVLTNLVERIPSILSDGFTVKLGALGSFRLSLHGEGVENEKDFDATKIAAKVIFTPSIEFKNAIKTTKFTKE